MGKTSKKIFWIATGTLAAWAVAIKHRTKGKPDMTVFSAYDYANGGLHDYCKNIPDNSLKSFERAMKHGYGIVMDVRITKDGVPVVFSDRGLWRMCSVEGNIEDKSIDELKEYRLIDTDMTIPTLEEALNLVDGQVPVLLNLKSLNGDYLNLCENCAVVIDQYDGVIAVEALDYRCIRWFMRYRPAVIRGQMFEKRVDFGDSIFTFIKQFGKNWLLTNFMSKPDFISSHLVDRKSISLTLCRILYHVPVMNWTVCTMKGYEKVRMDDAIVVFEDIEP